MSRMKCRVYISLSRYGAPLPTGCESASSRDEVMSALFSLSPGVALATVTDERCVWRALLRKAGMKSGPEITVL